MCQHSKLCNTLINVYILTDSCLLVNYLKPILNSNVKMTMCSYITIFITHRIMHGHKYAEQQYVNNQTMISTVQIQRHLPCTASYTAKSLKAKLAV